MSSTVEGDAQPRRTLLFTGHMVDAPDRAQPRFPATRVDAAARRIGAALDEIGAGPEDLALTQGAAGGDLLFAEACLARGVPLRTLERYALVMWSGFWLNAASGVLLLIAYPTKALTNPVFYTKLALIAIGLGMWTKLRARLSALPVPEAPVLPPRLKALAAASLICWGAGITAGRLLAYTYSRLTVDLIG